MTELAATYMGLPMVSPVVVAACSLSGHVENIQRAESAGAGGLVIKSLFENESSTFEGKRYSLMDAPMRPKPVQKPMSLLIGVRFLERTFLRLRGAPDETEAD